MTSHGITGLVGAPLALGAVALALGALLWHHEHHFQRLTAWLFALAGACFTLGIPALLASLAGLTLTGTGKTILGVAALILLPAFWLQAVRSGKTSRFSGLLKRKNKGAEGGVMAVFGQQAQRRHRYLRVATPVVALAAGALGVVVFSSGRILASALGKSAQGALAALYTSSRKVNDGTAAASVPASHRPGIIIAAVVAILLVAAVMRAHDKRKSKRGGGKNAGLPAGSRG